MKKKLLAVLLVILCISILGGTTAAYYNANGTAHNVITTGNVNIRVVEQQLVDGSLKPYPRGPISGVVPGTAVSKIVTVDNTGSGEAWVRVRLKREIEGCDSSLLPDGPNPELIHLNTNKADWEKLGEWYYYRQPLAESKSTAPLIEQVAFDADMGNAYQGCRITVTVEAQAVQARNNPLPGSKDYSSIPGWPTENKESKEG